MPSERIFLGWDKPVLPAAAAWLRQRFAADMSGVVIAVPTSRAGRRLLELLASGPWSGGAAGDGVFAPPRMVTVGALPELLYENVEDDEPVDELSAQLVRAATLRSADRQVLTQVFPRPPADHDTAGWFRLAEQLAQLSAELAAGRLTPDRVVEMAGRSQVDLALSGERWEALSALEQRYRDAMPQPDRQAARQAAIVDKRCGCDHSVVLVGLVDLSWQLHGMLGQVQNVTALVPAPEDHAEGFDTLGRLDAEYWQTQTIAIDDLRFAESPVDQAIELVRVLGEFPDTTPADEVVVGLGDEAAAGGLARSVELAGTPARVAQGRSLRSSPAVVLLDLLGRYSSGKKFADLAALVRHPDLEAVLGEDQAWITRLDQYASTYLQAETRGEWRGSEEDRQRFASLQDRLEALLPENANARLPWPAWSAAIAEVLARVYSQRPLSRVTDYALIETLGLVRGKLQEQATLDADARSTPSVTFAEAVSLTVSRLTNDAIPQPGGNAAVEMLGFLELPWDDAGFAVLTDVNEGLLPDSRNADAFLPNSLRSALDLPDNAQRFARDVLLMNIVLHSKQRVAVLACRHSAAGDPRLPSRLILACDEPTRIQRVKAFYPHGESPDAEPSPLLIAPGGESRFLIPRPLLDEPPITSLRVTAFRDYLACPYRFYLRHVLKLGALDDRAVELDALAYGNLAHDVLEAFGKSDVADATDGQSIDAFLSDTLSTTAHRKYGKRPRAAVRVQVEQLRERLSQFADHQAQLARDGWRIRQDLIETDLQAQVVVDGEPFVITGKIDRVDQHPTQGFRLLDYKTSDTGDTPRKTHGPRSRKTADVGDQAQGVATVWSDLQLPLYLSLVGPLGIERAELGYFTLPKSSSNAGVQTAGWDDDELCDAMAWRDAVIRGVRGGKFWPPNRDVPRYTDVFSRIAADGAMGRDALIERSASAGAEASWHG